MPTIEDVLPQLVSAKVFSTVDAKDGFGHIKLDDASKRLTIFETSFGQYRRLRLPFVISPATDTFQARMHEALVGLKGIKFIADDILIAGMGETEAEAILDHNQHLCALLDRCRERGIKLNKQKLKLNRSSMVFCCLGVFLDQLKVEAIMNMPPP